MAKKQKLEFTVDANTVRFAQGMRRVKQSARQTGRTVGALFGGSTGMMLGGGGLVLGMGMIAKQSVMLAGDLEQTAVAFEVLTGSADKAKSIISDLMQFSTATPFEPEQVLKAGKTLTALGVDSKNLMSDLKAIGDIASGTGKDFNELAVIFGKARTAGRLDGRDLNQLLEAGVPIIKQFAKQFKISEAEVRKYVSTGKVGFEDLRVAFQAMNGDGGRFFGMMEKQSKTFNGQLSTLTGNLKNIGIEIGNELLPTLNQYVGAINDIILAQNQLDAKQKRGVQTGGIYDSKTMQLAMMGYDVGTTYLPNWLKPSKSIEEALAGDSAVYAETTSEAERKAFSSKFKAGRAGKITPVESKSEKTLKEIKQEFTTFRQDMSVSGGRYV